MGDFDYGLKHGLWGNDGMPYSVKHERRTTSSKSSYSSNYSKSKRYNASEQLAYNSGFRAVSDGNAYNGRYFIKDGLKWIHNIGALKKQLRISNEKEMLRMGYAVDAYYMYH